jgi:hypothetical protein
VDKARGIDEQPVKLALGSQGRRANGKQTVFDRYYISNAEASAERMGNRSAGIGR